MKFVFEVYKGIKSKKSFLAFIGFLVFVYFLLKLILYNFEAVKVFEFAYISITFGLAPAYALRRALKFKNIIGWITNAGILAIIFIPILFLLLGWLGINVCFNNSILFLYICSVIGLIMLLFFSDEKSLKETFSFKNISIIDICIYLIFLGFSTFLTLKNFSHIYPRWDAFTFWGLDAKYIYEFGKLRDSSVNVTGSFKYTSFYPIFFSIIYRLYGGVYEQYASWINVYINTLALFSVYNHFFTSDVIKKILVMTLLIITSYAAIDATYMFSMYADILCAFVVLCFILVLTNDELVSVKQYWQRIILLSLLPIILFFIKDGLLFLSFFSYCIWIVYDIDYIKSNFNQIVRSWEIWVVVFFVLILVALRYRYFSIIYLIDNNVSIIDYYIPKSTTLLITYTYVKDLIKLFIKDNLYLFSLWIVGALTIVFSSKKIRNNKNYLFVYFYSLALFSFFCLVYIMNRSELVSGSIIRYTSIVMYIIPVLYSYLAINLKKVGRIVFITSISAFVIYIFFLVMNPMPLFQKFELSPGMYSEAPSLIEFSSFSKQVLEETGNEAKILIADEEPEVNSLTNMLTPAIYIRYFLMNNSVGGQYRWLSRDSLWEFLNKNGADYLLLLTYENMFDECSEVFAPGQNYLIPVKSSIFEGQDYCDMLRSKVSVIE